MKTEKIYTQHDQNKEWMNNLLFFQDDIMVMKNRLQEIASKNSSKEIMAQVEHFQNQLIIQKDQIDQLKHEINIDNDNIEREIKKNGTAVDHRSIPDHALTREKIKTFENLFVALRKKLNLFLSEKM